jgi:hypothetical protein
LEVAQVTEDLDKKTKKETLNGWKEGHHKTNMEKYVATEQEKESMQNLKPGNPSWLIYMG